MRKISTTCTLLAKLCTAVLVGILAMSASTAYAVQVLSVPESDQASDPVTVVEVNKLSFAEGHAAVTGATLQIVEASTGRVIYEWVSDGSLITINRSLYFNGDRVNLNLDTVYILREAKAPTGYEVAPDVRFEITGIYDSNVTIYDDGDGHAYLTGAHQITLYDDSTTQPRVIEDIEYVHVPTQSTRSNTEETSTEQEQVVPSNPLEALSQTGDTGYLPAIMTATAGLCAFALGIRKQRLAMGRTNS